jgi:hypothetical protein
MEMWKLSLLLIAVTIVGAGRNIQARPVDLSAPTMAIGASDSKGYLEIWREVEDIGLDLGKGSYLPFRYKFSSDDKIEGVLGPGFYVPMFEAKAFLLREQTMRIILPCGKGLYMKRDDLDSTKFKTLDQEWTGYRDENTFIMWRDDGWKLIYHKSRLVSITTDANQTFSWTYNDAGIPLDISHDNHPVLEVETTSAGQLNAITFGGKRYTFDYANQPMIGVVMGQTAVTRMAPSLSAVRYPDGRSETFTQMLTPALIPTMDFTDIDKKQTEYTWDPTTRHIESEKTPDNVWNYTVGLVASEFELPVISRTNKEGKTESIAVDTKTGTYTITNQDGSTTISQFFKTPGPFYDKVRNVEKVMNGQTTTIYKASYDELGRLARKVDQRGFVTDYRYKDEGNDPILEHTGLLQDPKLLDALKANEAMLLKNLDRAGGKPQARDVAIQDLVLFYIYHELDLQKAVPLIDQIQNPKRIFTVKLALIEGNPNLTTPQRNAALNDLIKAFPEQKTYIEPFIHD